MSKSFDFVRWVAIALSAFSLGLMGPVSPSRAQESYPSKPIQLVVTTAAGGALDLIASRSGRLALRRLASQGMQIVASSPAEMMQAMREDSKKWGDVIAATGITINQ